MSEFEDEPLELDGDVEFGTEPEGDDPARRRGEKAMTFRSQATRNLQRARKSMGADGEATPLTGFLVQTATVWALLDLADAVRESRQP